MENRLWYHEPASNWVDGFPIGNGRLAAMVLGNPCEERIALNHEWLWRGKYRNRTTEDRSGYLKKVRDLLLSGKFEEGTILANEAWGGNGGVSGRPCRIDSYQPAGDFCFKLDGGQVSHYCRELLLDQGVVRVSYEMDGARVSYEIIAHWVYGMIMLKISSENGRIGGDFWLQRRLDPECDISFATKGPVIKIKGFFIEGMEFLVEASIKTVGGKVSAENDHMLRVTDAEEIMVFINIGTSAKGEEPEKECARYVKPELEWKKILGQHVEEHGRLYGNLRMELPFAEKDIPTDRRLAEYTVDNDPGLPLLYFNYGRYLLCASSMKSELPANLQGKWNEHITPPWECDYHFDINLQMNYWIAESGNLPDTAGALFRYLESLVPYARKAARDLYGCEGICIPLSTDAWGRTTPEAYGWSVWIGAGPWLAQHMWWHYEYGQDMEFLKKRAYPFLKEVALFYESYLVEDEQGILQVVPSQSPENRFVGSGDLPVSIGISSAMDIELVRDTLSHCIKASELLDTDAHKRTVWKDILNRLQKLKLGSGGQLLEWNEEFTKAEPGHRHVSHLFGLYPGDLISAQRTPELYEAAKISLERRLATGGAHTGWSRAWTACLFARLGEGNKSFEHLGALIKEFSTGSLLDLIEAHHPWLFQIDGNLGGAAAVIEMIFQSYHEELDFLPALPKIWPEGKIDGLRARGGFTVNLSWKYGKLLQAEVIPSGDRKCTFKKKFGQYEIKDNIGHSVPYEEVGTNIGFDAKRGYTYFIKPI